MGTGEVERTLRHEAAHLLAHWRAGRRRIQTHGPEWRQACADLGIPGETVTHTLPLAPRRRQAARLRHAQHRRRHRRRPRPLARKRRRGKGVTVALSRAEAEAAMARGERITELTVAEVAVGLAIVIAIFEAYGQRYAVHPAVERSADIDDWDAWELVAPSAIAADARSPVPRALERHEIHQLAQDWGLATARAHAAGFDVVELHGAHGFAVAAVLAHPDAVLALEATQRHLGQRVSGPERLRRFNAR